MLYILQIQAKSVFLGILECHSRRLQHLALGRLNYLLWNGYFGFSGLRIHQCGNWRIRS